MLNGSAGEFFPSYREQTYVDFFTPDLCRYKRGYLNKIQKAKREWVDKVSLSYTNVIIFVLEIKSHI
jgi:hypothetical protein